MFTRIGGGTILLLVCFLFMCYENQPNGRILKPVIYFLNTTLQESRLSSLLQSCIALHGIISVVIYDSLLCGNSYIYPISRSYNLLTICKLCTLLSYVHHQKAQPHRYVQINVSSRQHQHLLLENRSKNRLNRGIIKPQVQTLHINYK